MNWFLKMAVLIFIWSLSWSIYKVTLAYTPPLLFSAMRCLIGGVLLIPFIWRTRDRIRWRNNWNIYVMAGILNMAFFFGFQTAGLNLVPSGLFSVIVYFQPILVGLFSWLWIGEIMSIGKVSGLILGFIGVISVSAEGFTGHISVFGVVLGLLSALSWALGTVYVKKTATKVDTLWMVAIQCLVGGVLLSIASFCTETWTSSITWNSTYLFGLIFGSIFGITVSWILYVGLVKTGDPSVVATYTFLVPLLAVTIGTFLLGEPFTVYLLLGIVLIVASIYLVNKKPVQPTSENRSPQKYRSA